MKYVNNTIRINFIFVICIVLLFVLFFGKLGYVALATDVEGTNLQELANSRTIATRTLKAVRGGIYDKTGQTLAQNLNSYTVIAILDESRTKDERYPKHVVDKNMTAQKLSEILYPLNNKMTSEYILGLLQYDDKYGSYQVELGPGGRDITEVTKQAIEALALPGIEFTKTTKRYYPNGDFASYIIGYAIKHDGSDEMVGELGIEGYTDRYLKGKDGSITYQKDAYGYQMAGRDTYETPAQDGYNVYLTLDANVQMYLENAMTEFEKYEPDWVTITVADANDGSITASATYPSFNPNLYNIKNYNNPLTSFTYEPGSTMKIFSFMSAMEEGKYDGSEKYASGNIKVDDYTIRDWNKVGWGSITFDTGFTYSSNVAAVKLAKRVGKNKLTDYYNNLGFGSQTGIELSNEYKGEIDFQYESELASASYGQGITVTPIQMIQALSVISNDGTTLKPYIIDKIIDPNTNEVVYQGKKTELKKVYSTSTINKIKELMDLTVNGEDKTATGRVYQTPAVRLIGKTGTANYAGSNGQYVTGTYNNIRSFAGVFPKENPEYIIYVAVKDFKGTSKNMGNIVKDIVESVAKYRHFDIVPAEKDTTEIVSVANYLNQSTVSAVATAQSSGLTPIIIGDGNMVIDQYPKSETTLLKNSKIFLMTNGTKSAFPDVIGWSSSDLVSLCNILKVPYELNGYGIVTSTNIKAGDIIDVTTIVKADLKKIDPVALTLEKKDDNDDTE